MPVVLAMMIVAAAVQTQQAQEAAQSAQREQLRQQTEQEKSRQEAVTAEVGRANQTQNTALGASTTSASRPSFGQSMLGQIPSVSSSGGAAAGSAGTF